MAGKEAGQGKRKGITVASGISPGYSLEEQGTLATLFQQKQQAALESTSGNKLKKGREMAGVGETCSTCGEDQGKP